MFILHSPPLHASCCEDSRAFLIEERKGSAVRLAKAVPNIKDPESEREQLNLEPGAHGHHCVLSSVGGAVVLGRRESMLNAISL